MMKSKQNAKAKALEKMKTGNKKVIFKGKTLAKMEKNDEKSNLREDNAYRR